MHTAEEGQLFSGDLCSFDSRQPDAQERCYGGKNVFESLFYVYQRDLCEASGAS